MSAPFVRKTLPNGLRVVLAPQRGAPTATVLILVEAGSEYEVRRENGISHFLEHLVFKGTTRRPRPEIISGELDGLGAEYNAFTGEEYTGYWAKAEAGKLPQILDLVSDMYLDPLFDPAEIDKERGVVIEEINMNEDTPMRRVHDVFTRLLYGDTPAGWPVAGRKEVIRHLRREDFVRYRAARYRAGATAVVIAGSFDPASTLRAVRKLFGGLRRGRASAKPRTRWAQRAPRVAIAFKESAQSHLVLGFRAFDAFDPRRHAARVLADILGGGMSSRLFRKVRGEMGSAYYVNAGADLSLDHGELVISAGVDHAKTEAVLRAIVAECRRLAEEPVGEEELRRTKDHLVGNLVIGLESSDEVASFYGGQEIVTGKPVPLAEVIRRVHGVSAGDIRAVARAIFRNAGANLAVIGPYKDAGALKRAISR